MPFAPDYVRLVLAENFEDAKAALLGPLLAIHAAHLVMLVERGIVVPADGRRLQAAIDAIDLDVVHRETYDGSYEDLFFFIDRLLIETCGPNVAGRLHTARSRNDIDMTMYRMRLRGLVMGVIEATLALRTSLLAQAARHRQTLFPAHTHSQPAQPTTVAHYLLAVVEQLERDTTRLFAAYASTNLNPLGACAITGTGFPIDRDRTSALLGFSGPTGNTYGSIATVDYLVESTSAAANLVLGLGRCVQDLLLWCTAEVGYLRLADGFVQTSSIMPQKRNPVALEHARAIASRAFGELTAIPQSVHNTPFGDIVDTEDDLQPLVGVAFRDATRAVALVASTMADAEFDVARMAARAQEGWVTLTELADTLVRELGMSFMIAHAIAKAVVAACPAGSPAPPLGAVLSQAAREAGCDVRLEDADIARILSPGYFVDVRRTHGGPAPEVTAVAIARSETLLAADRARLEETRAALGAAAASLRDAMAALGRG